MPQAYPVTLQDNFTRGTFNRVPGNNKVYSKTDTGPFKVRRRSTLRRDSISGGILLKDTAEYQTFMDWFSSTLQDGVLSFFFDDPALGTQMIVQFQEGCMQITDIGFQTYSVKMSLEVISE